MVSQQEKKLRIVMKWSDGDEEDEWLRWLLVLLFVFSDFYLHMA